MSNARDFATPVECMLLGIVAVLFAAVPLAGITWGLPSRAIDQYLFGGGPAWPGEKIYRLAGAGEKFSPQRGADVDSDPLERTGGEAIPLTATEADVAKIYLRYRLYTYQPDEMITMMALAGMRPGKLDLDPRLYQYGGLFIYPVGTLIGACGAVGLIDIRGDVVHYLDNPDEFGKFYVVARAYSAAWGLVGVLIVFAIARRLGGGRAGILAALLFTLMPVVVCMAHEGKPHLPGAVLMLLAVLLAMRHLTARTGPDEKGDPPGTRDWWLMCVCCGAAFGTVLSSWPIFVLIPLVALLDRRREVVARRASAMGGRGGEGGGWRPTMTRTVGGFILAVGVYLITNPYILINAFVNREVLGSNFGNSLAMYNVARCGEGFIRVVELTWEGVTLPILVLGVVALIIAIVGKNGEMIPLAVAAAIFFMQFVLIGAGKPAEYGRFGIFPNTALAIGAAVLLTRRWKGCHDVVNWTAASLVVVWVALFGAAYLWNFRVDAGLNGSRINLAKRAHAEIEATPETLRGLDNLAVLGEPGPYCCPPFDFSAIEVRLYKSPESYAQTAEDDSTVLLYPVDHRESWSGLQRREQGRSGPEPGAFAPRTLGTWWPDTQISWANKPFFRANREWPAECAPPPASDWVK